ncbi:hypothetical protein [Natronolimnobius baerhuensis]|uniref:Uncharacterized protein n=1 Tax=Natronolimnobius baerhuensis TaxID=253108 RepID=A0A202E4L6_9EURY|nr:hypothetical protein [Natronolimnobius baerhuensis]OVE83159.1 hypothetical protein B2G88_17265 [Natronolimnobius baerhuensis]
MTQRVICPHCSEKIPVDIKRKVLQTRTKPGTLRDDFDRSAVCSKCDEKFACKLKDPMRRRR